MQTPELTACQSHADEFERAAELALRQNQPLFAKELASHANYLRGQAEQRLELSRPRDCSKEDLQQTPSVGIDPTDAHTSNGSQGNTNG